MTAASQNHQNVTPLSRLSRRIAGALRGTHSRSTKPYFHRVPLLWPSIAALTGATLANGAGLAAAVLGTGLAVAALKHGRDEADEGGPGRRTLDDASLPVSVGPLVLVLLLFAAGTWRGLCWRGQAAWAERLASLDAYRITLLPIGAAVDQGQGVASFRARLCAAGPLEDPGVQRDASGQLVEIVAFSRDAGKVVPGQPLEATGKFAMPQRALNPGQFDRRRHLASERTFAQFE